MHDYPTVSESTELSKKVGNLSFLLVNDAEMAQRLAKLNLRFQAAAAPVKIHIKLLPVHIPADSMIYFTYAPRDAGEYEWSASDVQLFDTVSS